MEPTSMTSEGSARRAFLGRTAAGIGGIALAAMLGEDNSSAVEPSPSPRRTTRGLHFAPKAKRIIFILQAGGVSQFETFDHKPKLTELHGQPMPESLTNGQRLAQIRGKKLIVCGSPYKFKKYGQSGAELSELMPFTGTIADDICIVRTATTEAINHDPAVTFMQCGNQQPGRPTMGAWLSYGLASENRDLPSFVVLASGTN